MQNENKQNLVVEMKAVHCLMKFPMRLSQKIQGKKKTITQYSIL